MSYENFFCDQKRFDDFEHIINKYLFNKEYIIAKHLVELDNKLVAILINRSTSKKYTLKIKYVSNELEYFEGLIYPNLKQLDKIMISKPIIYYNESPYHIFLYEYIDGIDLFYFTEDTVLTNGQLVVFGIDIVNTLVELHRLNIIHCDIKLENVIISRDADAYLIDFEYSKVEDNKNGIIQDNIVGTEEYIAPESRDLSIYSKKTDIWQFGVLFYTLITNVFPLKKSKKNEKKRNEYKHINYDILKTQIENNNYSIEWITIVKKCLSFKDSDRPTAYELLDMIKNIKL